MSDGTEESAAHPGEVGRRAAARRRRLGLTQEETARRAGMAVDYLRYLEERPAAPSRATLARLAGALETSAAALLGAEADAERPPGRAQALLHPALREMDQEECRARLSSHGVGRVAVMVAGRPEIFPVNYEVAYDGICFRTTPGAAPAAAAGTDTTFEVDQVDDALSTGWSVLVSGPAEWVTDPGMARDLSERAHSGPWAGGRREQWIRIVPERVTGRRIVPAG
ncbi:helix-turn-helix domain-containing protein [Streptomyces palmae]|uniref:helix-turn-helix domain-containing protein n=1 Tax=Streptomyces palmae TaxID=1701085 RepID=UPI001FD7AD16|nr:pyridoxamine 5'-phosphate oxidase family protein [Streptomyces palmae]